jgi:hypothetical protein
LGIIALKADRETLPVLPPPYFTNLILYLLEIFGNDE